MEGLGNSSEVRAIGTDIFHLGGSFQGNAAASPLAANNRTSPGFVWTVARLGVGLYEVTMDASLTFPELPLYVACWNQAATLATDWFESFVLGEFNRTTRKFQIQCHRGGVAQELPATAGNRVNFGIFVRNTTGR